MNKNDKKDTRREKGFVDPKSIREFEVHKESELLSFLLEKLAPQSRNNVKRILANHQVSVGGAPVSQFNFKLYPEDVVIVSKNRIAKRERKDLPIIYEDEDIVAIDKPSGLLSIASDREKGKTAYRLVSDYITQSNKKARIFVVHRLDEDTSGVLIFAKKPEIKEALQDKWQEIVEKRGYYAIVEGEMEPEEGTLRDYLDQNANHLMFVTKNKVKGKLCITHYKKISYRDGYTLLDVNIDSGRKNQIRVQMGNTGHFVIGDDKYGEPADPLKRLGLHAYELIFTNPLNGKRYDLKADMPECFKGMFFKKKTAPVKEERAERKYRGGDNRATHKGSRDHKNASKPKQKRFGKHR